VTSTVPVDVRRLATRTLVAAGLLTLPVLVAAIAVVALALAHASYFVGMLAILTLVTLGLLRQARWGWWLAMVMGSLWLLSGVLTLGSIVTTGFFVWSPLIAVFTALYVISLASGLALLLTRAGRAPFSRRLAPPPITAP